MKANIAVILILTFGMIISYQNCGQGPVPVVGPNGVIESPGGTEFVGDSNGINGPGNGGADEGGFESFQVVCPTDTFHMQMGRNNKGWIIATFTLGDPNQTVSEENTTFVVSRLSFYSENGVWRYSHPNLVVELVVRNFTRGEWLDVPASIDVMHEQLDTTTETTCRIFSVSGPSM